MLQYLPRFIGRALRGLRPGTGAVSVHGDAAGRAPDRIVVSGTAIAGGGAVPTRFIADGPGVSPPPERSRPPPDAVEMVPVVEDADSPAPSPLVYTIVSGMPANENGGLPEGALSEPRERRLGGSWSIGRNSYRATEWLPPDPPTGHGEHRYVFQVFALREPPGLSEPQGRGAVLKAMRGKALGTGRVTGTYERP